MSASISHDAIARLQTLRRMQKISAQKLATEVTALGFPVSRAALANWEAGRKVTIPIDFVVLAATVLGTTVAAILDGPVTCPSCEGSPPNGFTCNRCGAGGEAA